MGIRKILFWIHLSMGVSVGLVILFLALTGLALTFERQITAWAERDVRFAQAPGIGTQRLGLDNLSQKVGQAFPDSPITGLTLYADPKLAPFFNLGQEGLVYLNPYSGTVLGRGAPGWRSFFKQVTSLHRWFGFQGKSRDVARQVKGLCTLFFGFLVLTGIYLWWPQRWTRQVFQAIGIPNLKLRGKPRDWNWHNALGFWCAPWLLVIIVTGLVMAFPWANDLLYRVTGNEPPLPKSAKASPGPVEGFAEKQGVKKRGLAAKASTGHLEAYLSSVEKQCPSWVSLNFKLPQGGSNKVTVAVEEKGMPHLEARSLLTLDGESAEVVKWEPYAGQNAGRQARSWVRPLHTGAAGGWIGQLLAALAAGWAIVQVLTGFSMARRRFWEYWRKTS